MPLPTSRSESLNSYGMFQPSRPYFFLSWMTALKKHSPKSNVRHSGWSTHDSSYNFWVTAPEPPPPKDRSRFALRPWGGSTVIWDNTTTGCRSDWVQVTRNKHNCLTGQTFRIGNMWSCYYGDFVCLRDTPISCTSFHLWSDDKAQFKWVTVKT